MNLAIFTIIPILLVFLAIYFKKRQNSKNTVGGEISLPKSLWLSYTIGTWFFLPISFLIWPVDSGMKYVYMFHLVSFWIRGVLELVMIYKWFNWSPRYGIAHDIFHFLGLIILFKMFWPIEISRPTLMSMVFMYSLIISVGFEIIFACWFLKIRGEQKHKIYFASNEPEWKYVNLLTYIAVIICYGLHIVNAWFVLDLAL
ncbi:hypothetical protein [Halobacteriovorax sp. HLS]|uniref:hypothetical protein n=1 Tax=Halobacteriovorax sp. HLS TaxID=2234000 RepID=UPI000FD6DFAC|nr:hypothetical protein [Halobacteriovorax sp. HLS]